MTTLGNYNHDFPRLAKQSGYFFQLYRGRVNWSEIENLNIEDIIENRNFQLLEQNLLNVVNCNLERDYDLKILDQNFVKLFKLAQLGVDYLTYCELYLDRCVVLLQEQLIVLQEDNEALKQENLKKNEEIKKNKKKNKIQKYQCDKCEKIFISEVYLKCHDKRRHSNPNTPVNLDSTPKKFISQCQQTEEARKLSASTQTFAIQEPVQTQEAEEIIKIKKKNNAKIENLEKELENLKSRLKKAETKLLEKSETSDSKTPNYPGPIFYSPLLPYLPSFLPPSRSNYEINPCSTLLECQSVSPGLSVNPETVTPKPHSHYTRSVVKIYEREKEAKEEKKVKTEVPPEVERIYRGKSKFVKVRKKLESNKENVDPNREKVITSPVKPLPLPRKIKKMFQPFVEELTTVEAFEVIGDNVHSELEFPFNSITRSSTPIKEEPEAVEEEDDAKDATFAKVDGCETNSNESLIVIKEMVSVEPKPKSFIKKMVTKNSPKLHELSKSLKKSLINLYDSVSLTGKDSGIDSKIVAVEKLNTELRNLGVDPDWSGIPKKTMKQKLKALRHRRKLLAKENPMFPVVRKNLEKNIFKKLGRKKGILNRDSNEQESIETQASSLTSQESFTQIDQQTRKGFRFEKPLMYNVETDSETEDFGSQNLKPETEEERVIGEKDAGNATDLDPGVGATKKEFDFSVFQVNKNEKSKKMAEPEVNELQTDSDFDTEFLDNLEVHTFKTVTPFVVDNNGNDANDKNEKIGGNEMDKDRLEDLEFELDKADNQSILKSSRECQVKPQVIAKKKVLFADVSVSGVNEIGKKDDDSWLTRSDWDEDED